MFRLKIAAYTLDSAASDAIRAAMTDISLIRSTLELHPGGIDAAIARYEAGEDTPDLLLVQADGQEDAVRAQLDRLSAVVSQGTQVVLLGAVDRIEFYRDVRALGIGEYVLSPITSAAFMRSVKEVYGQERSSARGRVVAVVGSKGGIGASAISHNLAWSLSRMHDRPVSIVDLDIHFGTTAIDFNHEHRFGLRDALIFAAGAGQIDEGYLERLFSKESDNLWLLASAPSLDGQAPMTPEALEAVIDTVASMADFVVLDVPDVWNPAIANALITADEVVVVSEPSLTGLRNTQLLFEAVGPSKPQGTTIRYLINGVGLDRNTEVGAKDFSEAVGRTPLLSMPWSPATFRSAGAQGRMLGDVKKSSKFTAAFDELARAVSGKREGDDQASKKKIGFFASLFGSGKKG